MIELYRNQEFNSWFPLSQFEKLSPKSQYLVIYHLHQLLEIFAQEEESAGTSLYPLIIQLKQKVK
jgi:hypothetical protein